MAKKKLYARPISRILDRETGVAVGWLYEWNTGQKVKIWTNGICQDYVFDA